MTTVTLKGELIVSDPQPMDCHLVTVFNPSPPRLGEYLERYLNQNCSIEVEDITGRWKFKTPAIIRNISITQVRGRVVVIRVTLCRFNAGVVYE